MNNNGYRHEDKYLLTGTEAVILRERARAIMQRDDHTGEQEYYSIRSLYFDDRANTCFYDTENGNDPRSKFRIRMYNGDTSYIRLEKKIKNNGMTKKVSAILTIPECEELIDGHYSGLLARTEGTKGSLIAEMQLKGMLPAVIVSYDRLPFTYSPCNIRFTIDKNLCYETEAADFLHPERRRAIPVRTEGMRIMELKWGNFLPDHIQNYLKIDTLKRDRFSKYYLCRAAIL